MTGVRLSRASLAQLPAAIERPAYDLAGIECGIVHLGLGGFHRAHMARYTHDLMQRRPDALSWGIAGAGLLAADRRMVESLAPQDRLYTLVERDQSGETVCVVGALGELIYAGDDTAPLLAAIDRAQTRIVSLTVTEHGYCIDASKRLDLDHPLIAADLADPTHPHSAVGVIVEGLSRRMNAGRKAFTALSCDNIQHNGRVLHGAVLAFAARRDPALADWIARHGRFPSTMVDRITPVTQAADIADLAVRYGVLDNWPVYPERFLQWVIEDDFADGRPDWDAVGAQFVSDVTPYEMMKLRLLNASHLAISGPAALMGYTFIDEAMHDPLLRDFMAALMDCETGPTVPPVPGIDLAAYKGTLVERFANPNIKDTAERINRDAALNYLLDPIRDRLAANQPIDRLALALAAWLRRVRGEDEQGRPLPIDHPLAELLRQRAIEGGGDPRPLLSLTPIFGELGADERLVRPVGRWLTVLYECGVRSALEIALQSSD